MSLRKQMTMGWVYAAVFTMGATMVLAQDPATTATPAADR